MAGFEHHTQAPWSAMEKWISDTVIHPDADVESAISSAEAAGMPAIEVAPNAGKFLALLVQISGARKVLEIGTLAGFSTIWMARALPADGQLISLEYLPEHARIAQGNLHDAGLADRAQVRLGKALETLPTLVNEAPFDLIFIDADKQNNSDYLEWAARLGRPGTVVVLDNSVWEGAPMDPGVDPVNGPGITAALRMLGADPRFDATVLQTVGSKGWDGFALAVLRSS